MKKIAVKNYNQVEGQKNSQNGNEFTVKSIIPHDQVGKCSANFVEIEPGNYAYGYHYHESNEEIFYIISGTGIVRTPQGEITVKAADAINHPFFISLPTYGYEILYSESGQFVGLHAEGPSYYPPYVSRRKIVTTKPDEILSFLNWLDGNKVANLTGICWFRLPVDSDEFNWSVDSLKAVIQRRKPALSFSVRHEYRDKNLVEVYLTNNGEQNTEKSVYFSIAWKGHGPAIHDVFGKYRELERSGNEETEIVGPAPKTGHEIMVGWFRFDNFKNDKPSFEISRVEFYEKN